VFRNSFSRQLPLAALAALAVLLPLAACEHGSEPPEAHAAPTTTTASGVTLTPAQQSRIHLVTAAVTSFEPTVQTTGTVTFNGDRSTQVLSPVSGPVTRILVQPGTSVTKGQPLATVSSPDFASAIANYRKAQASAQNLQRIAEQDVQLFKTDAISRREVEQAQTDASAAVADREAALEQLRALGVDPAAIDQVRANPTVQTLAAVIRAPISGTLVERLITPGQLLQASTTPAFTIADLSTVWVMASVFESDLGSIHRGESATVTTDASAQPFEGTVDYVSAVVDSATRATAVRLVVRNRADLLKRDMFVRVGIHSDRARSGILIPEAAVLRDEQNLPFVFVASSNAANPTYLRRGVTLGAHVGDSYEVTQGLQPGDRVVGEGALFLQFAENQ
jgi:cobalt-zinc-cadmium efflux system membrane fusion protein